MDRSAARWATLGLAGTTAWLGANLHWLSQDKLLRDGDEEGHVGAAELLRLHLDGGSVGRFFMDAWQGDLGEYPAVFPALVGGWWWLVGGGDPGQLRVRAVNLIGLLVAALATGGLASRLAPSARWRAGVSALLLVLTLPLGNGLARHFMPEGLLTAAVAVAVLLAHVAGERRHTPSLVALGIALGVGVLVKQTFVLLAALPVLAAVAPARVRALLAAGVATAVAGPWVWSHAADQAAYAGASVQGGHRASLWAHALYYPAVAVDLLAGPVVVMAAAAGAWQLCRRGSPQARGRVIAGAWVAGIVLLMVIPKKYPRLAAPLAPGLVLLAVTGLATTRTGGAALVATITLSAGWSVWRSTHTHPPASWVPVVDEKCPQVWLRAPHPSDLGLSAVVEAARHAPGAGPVAVIDGPTLPCALQTTHPWASHLPPALRRAGVERQVHEGPAEDASVVVRFIPLAAADPGDIPLPELDRALVIRTTR